MTGPRVWLFGKLPSHGDFIARGLDAEARAAWDAWLSDGLAGARAALGEGFDAAYEAAPPWRFVLGPGALGDSWRAGAMTPSVDAVGRRFPVVMAVDGLTAEEAAGRGAGLAAAMDDAIRDAFAQGLTADAALEAAQARAATVEPGEPLTAGWWTEGGDRLSGPAAGAPASELLTRLWAPVVEPAA